MPFPTVAFQAVPPEGKRVAASIEFYLDTGRQLIVPWETVRQPQERAVKLAKF